MKKGIRWAFAVFGTALLPAQRSGSVDIDQPVILEIETRDAVLYRGKVFDASKLGVDPGVTTSSNTVFLHSINAADIVAVNGKPAKGLWQYHVQAIPFRTNPAPRQAIADVNSGGLFHCHYHILQEDGSYVGEITDLGVPAAGSGHAVNGGLGAFLGATGITRMVGVSPQRGASTSEDPANRRTHGGGTTRHLIYLYPKYRPEIEMTPNGPAIFHADLSPVSVASPARPGEILILRATGLGPVRPALDPPGLTTFTSDPHQEVNSPIEVLVNDREATVVNKIGWPGERNLYRVDFEVPPATTAGTARLRLAAAWIPGSEVSFPVQ